MTRTRSLAIGAIGSALLLAAVAVPALTLPAQSLEAQSLEPQSLRGDAPMEEAPPAPEVKKQNIEPERFTRAYRQQPPLIPHKIDRYQINVKVNQCLRCHDWPYSVEEGAPKISETHYFDRNGVALDKVARIRWFCTQCHVPQVNARALIDNTFKSAIDVE